MDFNFKVEDMGEWPDLEGWLPKVAQALEDRVKLRTPERTGDLKRSIKAEVTDEAIEVGSDVHYAPHVEYGTINMSGHAMFRTALEEFGSIADSVKVEMTKEAADQKPGGSPGKVNLSK